MIIGINGKIGAGKDTVGKIIQHLTSEWADEEFQDTDMLDVRSNWKIKKFAGKLKQIASILTGISVENFEDQEFKKQYMPEEWAVEIWNDPNPIEGNDYCITSRIKYEDDTSLITYNDGLSEAEVFDHEIEKRLMTYREFLQKLGTEAMRDGLHTNVWVNALFADYKPLVTYQMEILDLGASDLQREKIGKPVHSEYPNWILTDMRFPNELESVEKRHGITIRVIRNNGTRALSDMNNHPSEISLDDSKFDYEINNDGTMEELVKKVRDILVLEELI